MHLGAARQCLARLQRLGVGEPGGVAESDHPGVVHGQEIEHRAEKRGIGGTGTQVGLARAGGAEEHRQKLLVPREPAERLEGNGFGIFLLHRRPFAGLETLC